MFLWEDASTLQRTIALVMMVVCGLGEVLAAIFGMQIEAWQKAGFTMTEQDFNGMLLVIGILGVAHFLAMFGYFAGDKIKELLTADADQDGIPDYRDSIDNRTGKPFERKNGRAYAADVEQTADPTQRQR